jgi:hypothetical protein
MSTAHPIPPILSATTRSKGLVGVSAYLPIVQEPAQLRRPTATQGRAIEILGHAIEYLVDSRLASADEFCSPAAQEAIQLLSRANREVYLAAPEMTSGGGRVMRWLLRICSGTSFL